MSVTRKLSAPSYASHAWAGSGGTADTRGTGATTNHATATPHGLLPARARCEQARPGALGAKKAVRFTRIKVVCAVVCGDSRTNEPCH